MEIEYKDLIKYTVLNNYPDYIIDMILEDLKLKKLIKTTKKIKKITDDAEKENLELIDVSMYSKSKDKLNHFLEAKKDFDFCGYIDNYEWGKAFRFAVLLNLENFNYSVIDEQIKNRNILIDEDLKYDNIVNIVSYPQLRKSEDNIILKFSLLKAGAISDDKTVNIKYPVVVVIDPQNSMVEIRFDQIKTIFQNKRNFYWDLIDRIISWLGSYININLSQIELKPIIQKIIDNYNEDIEEAEIIPMKRDVSLKNGSKVVFDIDANKNFIEPIIGDLKFIVKNYKDDLEKVPKLERELQKLISTVEQGDIPKVSLFWRKESILLGVAHNYKDSEYSLLHYYGEIKDSRMMDYVREYFKTDTGKS